jgi:hypothetical protein
MGLRLLTLPLQLKNYGDRRYALSLGDHPEQPLRERNHNLTAIIR